jgi:hypothetical protein
MPVTAGERAIIAALHDLCGWAARKDVMAITKMPAAQFDHAVRRLRWSGRLSMDGYRLSPGAMAEEAERRAKLGETQAKAGDEAASLRREVCDQNKDAETGNVGTRKRGSAGAVTSVEAVTEGAAAPSVTRADRVAGADKMGADEAAPALDAMSGAELAALLRARAAAAGVTLTEFVRPLWPNSQSPGAMLQSLSTVQRVKPATRARVSALLRGEPLPPSHNRPRPGVFAPPAGRADQLSEGDIEARRLAVEEGRAAKVRAAVAAEAAAAVGRRAVAGALGQVRGPRTMQAHEIAAVAGQVGRPDDIDAELRALPLGARLQLEGLRPGAGSAAAVLRDNWARHWALLAQLSVRTGERPIPLLCRLIEDEAREVGVKMARRCR